MTNYNCMKSGFIAAALVLSGCQTAAIESTPVSVEMPPAPLPTYAVGATRTMVDLTGEETVDTIVSIDGDQVSWESNLGVKWTTYKNFALPSLSWSTKRFGTGTQSIGVVQGELFPLVVGNTSSVSVSGKSSDWPDGWKQQSKCEVKSQQHVTVPAGEFDTYMVVCRAGDSRRTFHYAPEIGQVVSFRNDRAKASSYGSKLVSFQ